MNLYVSDQSLRELAEQSGSPLPGLQLADRPDRAVYGIGRLLVDEFQSMGGLAPAMIDHAIVLIARRILIPKWRHSGEFDPCELYSRMRIERHFIVLQTACLEAFF